VMDQSHLKKLKREIDDEFTEVEAKKQRIEKDLKQFEQIEKTLEIIFEEKHFELQSNKTDVTIALIPFEKDCDRYACSCTRGSHVGFLWEIGKNPYSDLSTEIINHLMSVAKYKYGRRFEKIRKDNPLGDQYSRFGTLYQYEIIFRKESNEKSGDAKCEDVE
jgi:hypothetical protein